MPAAVACPKCKKKYNLPDKLLGKPVKCTQCSTQFRTPSAGQAKRPGQTKVDPRQLEQRRKAEAAARKKESELQMFGVDGPIRKAPDVFDGLTSAKGTADPLNNMMLEDPGFGDINTSSAADDSIPDVDPHAEMFENPYAPPKATKKKRKKKKKRAGDGQWFRQPWFMILAVFIPLLLIHIAVTATGLLSPQMSAQLMAGIWVLNSLASIVVTLWGVGIVNEEMNLLHAILSFFIPFYIIYPVIAHWDAMKGYAFAILAQIGLIPFFVVATIVNTMAGVDSIDPTPF